MHTGHGKPKHQYNMAGQILAEMREDKDIGVTVADTLKQSVQCARAAKIAQMLLSWVGRALHYHDSMS
jgi:hypothetical protein